MNTFTILGFICEPNFHKISLFKQFLYSFELIIVRVNLAPFDDAIQWPLLPILDDLLSAFVNQFLIAILYFHPKEHRISLSVQKESH